jgi:hypothetical protein
VFGFLLPFTSNLKHDEILGKVPVQEKLCQNFIKIKNFITLIKINLSYDGYP